MPGRKQFHQDEKAYADLLNSISQVQERFFADTEARILFEELLNNVLSLTQSEFGFIGQVLYADNGKPYLKTHAISNVAWNEESRKFYDKNAPSGLEFYNTGTLFGAVLSTGKPVVANHPTSDPLRGGHPKGHPPLQSFLGLPLYCGKKLFVGMVGVANRPGGYDEKLLKYLQPFLSTCGNIIEAYRSLQRSKQTEVALLESKNRLSGLINAAVDAIIAVDESQRITLFNSGAEKIFGYQASEVIQQPLDKLIPKRFAEAHSEHIHNFRDAPETARLMGQRREIFGLRKDGTEFPAEASISKLTQNGRTTFTVILRDITERIKSEETIRRLAYYDLLTDLPNRAYLLELMQKAIGIARSEHRTVAFILMDLDNFKDINDTLGHKSGDILLKKVAELIKSVLWEPDRVSRLGGDEFAVLLPKLAAAKDIDIVIKKIQNVLTPPIVIRDLPIFIDMSIGISLYPKDGSNAVELMQHSDVAMYAAKKAGVGYLHYDPRLNRHSPKHLTLMSELRYAIDHDELMLYFQPKIDFKSKKTIGVEALLRWDHPDRGFIPPDQFIPLTERTGLIKNLTLWVVNEAFRECHNWRQAGVEISLAVNLSARNLQDLKLPHYVIDAMKTWDIDPTKIIFEITESAIMADPARAKEVLTRMHDLGVKISIDDFGTGYSSLASLRGLPVDEIKIDRSFVKNMVENENDTVIARTTIDLAHNLGLRAVAEGVENQETWESLNGYNCDAAQGYLMSRPLPAGELVHWLAESSWGLGKN